MGCVETNPSYPQGSSFSYAKYPQKRAKVELRVTEPRSESLPMTTKKEEEPSKIDGSFGFDDAGIHTLAGNRKCYSSIV
jgi:hypothetical protein